MSHAPAPPGGPLNPEFRDAIDQLAQQARDEDRRADADAKKRLSPRRLTKFIRIGLILIALQAALYGYLYSRKEGEVTKKAVATKALFPEKTCNAVMYRTYWKVVSYLRDEGHPPAGFEQMLGKYLDKLPVDPVSQQPLIYSTDGKRFDVRCPGTAAKR